MNEQWEEIRPFCEGMACVKKDGKYGLPAATEIPLPGIFAG